MSNSLPTPALKEHVRDFWNADPCGTRYLEGNEDFHSHARARYSLEPYIADFAKFADSRGLRVLEIGVGMGADYLEWLRAGAFATGVDISAVSLSRAKARCATEGFEPDLRISDAEHLPFADNTFDVVYSYGVMHHSPDTQRCINEALRVLKAGGEARIMLYHHASLTGAMLWLRYGFLAGKSLRRSAFDHLESPGTKTYTRGEVETMMRNFANVEMQQVFSPGDLLLHAPSPRFQSRFYSVCWKIFPRGLVRRIASRWGLFLLVSAHKPRR